MIHNDTYQIYQRQINLPGFGIEAQARLLDAHVLIIGAGGLGCPILQYLAAAGVGHITLIDFDNVEQSNLHRQILFGAADVGQPKAIVAAERIKVLHPHIHIVPINAAINQSNVFDLIEQVDLVIDGSDNFFTRYLVNDACVLLNKPLIYGSIYRFEGQVGVFNLKLSDGNTSHYRHFFPLPPGKNEVPNCSEAGVIGVLPGMIGIMQATEAIKVLTGIGKPLYNTLLTYDILQNRWYELNVLPYMIPPGYMPETLDELCSFSYPDFCSHSMIPELSFEEFMQQYTRQPHKFQLIDVRELHELPPVSTLPCTQIPLSELMNRMEEISKDISVIFICQSGKRSRDAVGLYLSQRPKAVAYSLLGGIIQCTTLYNKAL